MPKAQGVQLQPCKKQRWKTSKQLMLVRLGQRFSSHFAFLPAQGTRGGALIAVDEDFYSISHRDHREHTVSVCVESTQSLESWWITVVYGPQGDREKVEFMRELREIKATVGNKWLLIGDFNLILQAADKSNANLNRRLMGEFRNTLNYLEVKELNLRGRKFTWSNDVTQTRIDRAFCSVDWDIMLPASSLQALSSTVSDHSPLLLVGAIAVNTYKGFRFESFWPKITGYSEVVQAAWDEPVHIFNPFLRLHIKLSRTAKAIKHWSKKTLGNNKLLLRAARQPIGIFDVVQEHRQLSTAEILLRRDLKARFLGLTAVEKLRAKQQSRLTNIRAAEASSKLFYLQANGRRRKNFIRQLHSPEGIMHTHEEKANCVLQHFSNRLGTQQHREVTLDWNQLNVASHDLQHLEEEFSEEELMAVVQDIAPDKAPGPNGFIGVFYKASWAVVKGDILAAANYFYTRFDQHFNLINNAHIVLLPKREDASRVGDFRPISLSHSVAKLISKMLAARLSTELDNLVSRAQSAFIKRRSIQDNFLYTQNLIKGLHGAKKPTLFLKLDIAKAFDTV